MIDLTTWLSAALIAIGVPWYAPNAAPETPEQYAARVEMIARATVEETSVPPEEWPLAPNDLAAAVAVVTWEESGRYRLDVHSGARRGDRGEALGLGQIHFWPGMMSRAEWRESAGADELSTRAHVRLVAKILAFHAQRCRVTSANRREISKVFSAYGSGYSCSPTWQTSQRRARLWARLRAPPE